MLWWAGTVKLINCGFARYIKIVIASKFHMPLPKADSVLIIYSIRGTAEWWCEVDINVYGLLGIQERILLLI